MHKIFAGVTMPSRLKEDRAYHINIPGSYDTITDNPLLHGATYVAVKTKTSYRDRIFLYADLYAEQRGVSYGLFNTKNSVVYPVMRMEVFDTLRIRADKIILTGKFGEFLDEQLDEGLMVYNMDVQGAQLSARYRSLTFQVKVYGDLDNGIGLNIDDLYSYTLKRSFDKSKIVAGASWVIARPPFAELKNHFNLNLFARKHLNGGIVYAQGGFRPFNYHFTFSNHAAPRNKWAAVAGTEIKKQKRNLAVTIKAEARYYGNFFNADNYNPVVLLYRERENIFENYANTVGPYLYPLRKFDSPFSQWAVFTEFSGFNIGMVSLIAKPDLRISDKFDLFADLDLNYITGRLDKFWDYPQTNRSVDFLYPFVVAGLAYIPVENATAKISITNKSMNLDLPYPTHYLLKKPCLQLSVLARF